MKRSLTMLICACVIALGAACGGDDSEENTTRLAGMVAAPAHEVVAAGHERQRWRRGHRQQRWQRRRWLGRRDGRAGRLRRHDLREADVDSPARVLRR